jgi:GntR family transcriptional regulator, transcriptional repressor for pyruvate dehydrogenase complex
MDDGATAQGDGADEAATQQATAQFDAVARSLPVFVQVANQLIAAVQDGRFPVGARLPSEQQLAAQFGVSRPSIREALSCLQFEGYVAPRQGSRTVVTSAVPRSAVQGCPAPAPGPAFSIADLFEARLTLEPQVVALAAADPDPRALPAVRQILAGMKLALSEPGLHPRTDLEVHTALVRVCRNTLLVEATEHLLRLGDNDRSRRARDGIWAERSLPWEWLGHHEEMAVAVMERDPDYAAATCKRHLISVLTSVAASPRTSAADRDRLTALTTRVTDQAPAPPEPHPDPQPHQPDPQPLPPAT